MDESHLISTTELANIFGVSTKWVQELQAKGVIRKSGHGKWDVVECCKNYIAWLKDREKPEPAKSNADSQDSGAELDPKYQRARLHAAQSEKVELENAIKRGEYVNVAEVRQSWLLLQTLLNSRIDAIPGRMAGALAARLNADRAIAYDVLLEESIHIRESISNGLETLSGDPGDGGNSQATSKAGSVGMG